MDDDKMTREELLADEGALLQGLLEAGEQVANADGAATVEIARSGRLLLAFKIRPLTEAEFMACREKATQYKAERRPSGISIRVAVDHDPAGYRSRVIVLATLPATPGGKTVWEQKEAWQRFNVLNAVDLIDKVLLGGEKERAYNLIERISGYSAEEGGTDAALEEFAGNS